MNPLIRLWFDTSPHNTVSSLALQHENLWVLRRKNSLANFSIPISLSPEGGMRPV